MSGLCFITYILWGVGGNKDMVTERTPLGNKSRQTNERCLVDFHTKKVSPGHTPS